MERCSRISSHPEQIVSLSSFNYYQDGEKFRQQINEFYKEYEEKIITIIKKGQLEGELDPKIDPKNIYLLIIGILNRFVMEWQRADYNFNLYEEGSKLWNYVESLLTGKK